MGLAKQLANRALIIFFAGLLAVGHVQPKPAYRDRVLEKVHQFGSLNQVDQYNLHGSGDAECAVAATVEATISRDGSLRKIEVITPSSVAVFNNWSRWIFEQSAPFDSLDEYFPEGKDQYVLRQTVRMQGEMIWCSGRGKHCCSSLQLVQPAPLPEH